MLNPEMGKLCVTKKFISMCKASPDKSEAVVSIEVLAWLIESSDVSAVQGLNDLMVEAIEDMCKTEKSNISVQSACELFQRFITLAALDTGDFEECKRVLLERSSIFINKART
ncbi:unnamed protein product [Protopolystoma xenopodis]|uniref:Translation initiation factor eIF2B subunit alpha n=1 Tax=Protopolystoma xenopodis TaxID=117903 RepID=A0A3S5BZV2_9PLAT|nr:unnamed protein product [Protopolystoma xenopodis]